MSKPRAKYISRESIARYGITEVSEPVDEASVDIVLVHDLNGHPYDTWRSIDGGFWPVDRLLPSLVDRKVRILVYGYLSDSRPSLDRLEDLAWGLSSALYIQRRGTNAERRPIIFVTHSLGGLLVEQALVLASGDSICRPLYISTHAIISLETPLLAVDPHRESDLAHISMVGLATKNIGRSLYEDKSLYKDAQIDNYTVEWINLRFQRIAKQIHLCCLHKTEPPSSKGQPSSILDQKPTSLVPESESLSSRDKSRFTLRRKSTLVPTKLTRQTSVTLPRPQRPTHKDVQEQEQGIWLVVVALKRNVESATQAITDNWLFEEERPPMSLSDRVQVKDPVSALLSELLKDAQLYTSFRLAFEFRSRSGHLEAQLSRLLEKFLEELKEELSHQALQLATIVRIEWAEQIARGIRKIHQYEKTKLSVARRRAMVEVGAIYIDRLFQDTFYRAQTDDIKDGDFLGSYKKTDVGIETKDSHYQRVDLGEFRQVTISSRAFTRLRSSCPRVICSDPCAAIKEYISHEYCSEPDNGVAEFQMNWDIVRYVQSELAYLENEERRLCDILSSVITINGTRSKAYATKAADYVRWKWPQSRWKLLEALELCFGKRDITVPEQIGPQLHLGREFSSNSMLLLVRFESLQELIEISQQLLWLSASFRCPKNGQNTYSEACFEQKGPMKFRIWLLELEEIQQKPPSCWLPLFKGGIVARGFPIPDRHGEKGLELPFSVMTGLANIMYPMMHNEKLYLRGFSRILFPTAISPDSKSVQWHLMSSADPPQRLRPGTLPPEDAGHVWIKTGDLESLASAERTFLGYCNKIDVHLGTQSANYETVDGGGADDEKPAPGATPKSLSAGTSGLGIFGVQLNVDILLPCGLFATMQPGWYVELLDDAEEMPVIVYDNAEEIKHAWLVPKLSVVLHLVHIWARDKDDLLASPPFAKLHWNCGLEAAKVIKAHSRDELRDALDGDKVYRLKDLVERLLLSLDKLVEIEALAKSEPRRIVKAENSKLYGWDLLEIAKGKRTINRKQLSISEDWVALGNDLLVLFCKNLGHVIQPASGVRLCPEGDLAKNGSNHLTATVQCLQHLSKERGGLTGSARLKLSDRIYWQCSDKNQFKDCEQCILGGNSKRHKCLKCPQGFCGDQLLSRKDGFMPPIEGAVTFGRRRLQKERVIPKVMPFRKQTTLEDRGVISSIENDRRGESSTSLANVVAPIIQIEEEEANDTPAQAGQPKRPRSPNASISPNMTDASSDELSNPSPDTSAMSSSESAPRRFHSIVHDLTRLVTSSDNATSKRRRLQKKPKT